MVNLSDNGKKDVIIEFAKVKKKFNEQVVCQDISFKVYKNDIWFPQLVFANSYSNLYLTPINNILLIKQNQILHSA